MVNLVGERLELRLNWFMVSGRLLVGGAIAIVVAATSWDSMRAGSIGGEVVFALGGLLGLALVAIAVRSRLILTPEGFSVRLLWAGRLVPWSAVRTFKPDPPHGGLSWSPRERPTMPATLWQWFLAIWHAERSKIPFFGPNRTELLATMNAWLAQYAPTDPEPTEQRTITVDDERLLREDPRLRARLDELRRRQQAGKSVSPAELGRLFEDLSRSSSSSEEPPP